MGYKLLNEIENYMWEMTIKNDLGWLEIKSLAPALKDERDLFLNGKINEKELYNRMKLIKPVLEFREDFQKLIIRRF